MGLSFEEHLRFRLLTDGVTVDPAARVAWTERFGGPLTLAEYATTSGVSVRLRGDLYVNAPLMDIADGPRLCVDGDTFFVQADGVDVTVEPIPVPAFHQLTQLDVHDSSDQAYTNYGVTHTDRCRVSPISGCAWKCHFCDLPYEFSYRKRHEDNMLETIRVAANDRLLPARHVLVSGGTPRAPVPARDGRPARDDEAWIDGVYAYLAKRSPIPVDVMMPARRSLSYPARLRAAGVNMLSVNLEVSEPARARIIAPIKARYGREHFLDYVEAAVEAFGVGFVQSLVVFGEAIESPESSLRGIRDLVDRGCIPVLSPFRPHGLTPLRDEPAATLDETLWLYDRTLAVCEKADNGVRPGPRCVPCHHNIAVIPDGTSFYVDLDGDLTDRTCLHS